MQMQEPEIFTFKDVDKAQKYLGQQVIASNNLWSLENNELNHRGILTAIHSDFLGAPFEVSNYRYQFLLA